MVGAASIPTRPRRVVTFSSGVLFATRCIVGVGVMIMLIVVAGTFLVSVAFALSFRFSVLRFVSLEPLA
jgi:hypothetical protein